MKFKKSLISSGIALAIMGISAHALAQEPVENNATETTQPSTQAIQVSEKTLEEITVTGIKASWMDSMEMKRNNVGTMEAISAEDFGKFPDGNLAESLARVPGIAIDRSNVEGQKIAVRGFGPEFNLVTLNGRQMPTVPGVWDGGRSFNFGDIASPGVSALEVYKSTNSALPSGGIGATVNMITTKPLEIEGSKKAFSFNLLEDTTSEASGTPIETAFLYSTNQDRWGFSLSGSYQERQNREEGTKESNWVSINEMAGREGYLRADPSNPAYTNNNQRADGETFYQEPTAYLIKDNDRTRSNAQATVQFQVTEDIVTTLDYTYSKVDFKSEGTTFGSWLGGWSTDQATINENGAFTDVVVNSRSYDHDVTWQHLVNENKSIGFNTEWMIDDAWTLNFDAHHSTAEADGGELDNTLAVTPDNQGTVTNINGGSSGINTFSYDTDFAPSNYLVSSATIRDGFKENEIKQYQIGGEWLNLDGDLITSVEFGISHLDNSFTKIKRDSVYGSSNSAADYDDALFNRTALGDFMNSFSPNIGTDYYYQVDPQAALAAFAALNPMCCGAGDIDSNERVEETLDSAFVQFNMETELAGKDLSIVTGLRYEKADTVSTSLSPTTSGLRWDMIEGIIGINDGVNVDAPRSGSNSMVLPSIALALELDDQQVVRLSLSKSIGRPGLTDLSSHQTFGNRDGYQATVTRGNPELEPMSSNNFDLAYENYYAEGSYFSVNYFRKDVKNFVGSSTEYGAVDGLNDPSASAIGIAAQACVQDWVDDGRPQGTGSYCVSENALIAQTWMTDAQHVAWVALRDTYNGGAECFDGWWRCEPGYIDGTSSDPAANFEINSKYNLNKGTVSGLEFAVQHLFEGTPYGVQFNATWVHGGDTEVDKNVIGEQFLLPGLGDSGNLSFFFENPKHTARIALNYRGETVAGFANYNQPLFVDARTQVDASYSFNYNDNVTMFVDATNITDEETRLFVRNSEMLFLSQDHGPVVRLGVRTNF